MVQMASAAPNETEPNQTRYRPLEEFHIFVIANILHRPIVVFADTSVRDDEGNSWAPIPFGGIYLPLLHTPAECVRSPILLGYNNQHFTPLLTTQTPPQNGASPSTQHPPQTISLMRQTGERLPVQYILPEEEDRDVLSEYLNIIPAADSSDDTLLAALDITPLPDHLNLFKDLVECDCEGTPQQRNGSLTLSSFQKPVSVVRPLAKATSNSPTDNTTRTTESMRMPVPCTEDVDGPQASHSPMDESLLRMKLHQGEQTATVVNPEQLRMAPPDYAAATVPPLPIQENIATLSNFGQSQHTIAGPSGSSSVQPRASAPPLPSQRNIANPLNGADTGRSQVQQHVANEEGQHSDGMIMQDIHRTPNGRNKNSQNDGSVSAASRPSYAAAVKSNPGPVPRQSAPKPKLFSAPPRKPTCKNPECKGSPCPQNGGYCTKCHRKNSAEKRRERRESLTSRQGSSSRAGTPVHIGRTVNQKHKQKGAQTMKPKRPQTAVTSSSSLVVQKSQQQQARGKSTGEHSDRNTQRSGTLGPHQSYSPETPPSKVFEASMQAKRNTSSIRGKPASFARTYATDVPSQVQLPGPAQYPDLGGTCKMAGCSGLGLPQAGGFCLDCWSKQEDAALVNMQQSQTANSRAQVSSRAPRNNYKEAKRKANLPAMRNGGINPALQPCTAPSCEGVVDERVHAALCPECFSHLERRNSSPTQSQAGSGGAADSLRSPSTSTSAPSPVQPAVHFAQEPNVQRCVTKGCKRSATRENGFFCGIHAASGNLQQGWSHHQGSTNNTSQQFQSYTQPPSISSSAPISLTFNGTVEQLHVHHHHYPAQNVPQSNGTGGLESQPRSPFSAQEAPQSGLGMRGSESMPWQSNGFPSRMHNNGAAAPVSEYGPVCPKCGKPGNAWFNDLCQKCQQQQQK
ncbi:tumor necrosis factor alpha-induced protein 3-like [Branchiostoma floridae]|uniref:ubiquitinyl hydrolase 1 n=1 Tax=Branchiostoma floridae TaxID=7739 RepID=C3ZYU6_BRAFL|nr:tumor necrosis factor alpha-induced protein 3-like [Branchiostoma floridae]|eukprot:XP_002586254.1 hypothetical protein BRAFLDRAFT_109338 [Branchiostoma floridae]